MATTNRTLKFLGTAYGDSDVTIKATIDNVVVYNSTVTTLDEPPPVSEDIVKPQPVLFSVENSDQFPTTFAGTLTMTVEVTGGEIAFLDQVLCNYMTGREDLNDDTSPVIPGNATRFLPCYHGTPTNSEGTGDCRSNVTLNGNVQVPPLPASAGTLTWGVPNGSILACNFNISRGHNFT
jgi:hypothetical protein